MAEAAIRSRLKLNSLAHGQVVVGAGAATTANVTLQGRIVATTFGNPAGLFRKWYSSLGKDVLGTSDQLVAPLAVGSHTITYTVKDKNEDGVPPAQLEALFKSVEHIGATGGPPDPPPADGRPCVVHVLIANMVAPLNGANLSKANAVLEAQAPLQWGKYVAGRGGVSGAGSGVRGGEQGAVPVVFYAGQSAGGADRTGRAGWATRWSWCRRRATRRCRGCATAGGCRRPWWWGSSTW